MVLQINWLSDAKRRRRVRNGGLPAGGRRPWEIYEMFEAKVVHGDDKAAFYRELAQQLGGLLTGERDAIANAANTAALLFTTLPDLNWAGFYFLSSPDELVLGPFQGKPACVRIAVGRGVCGAAVEQRRTMLVEDVHAFADHIACDADSRSELVVPLIRDDRVLGVIDLDSPLLARFDGDDQRGIEAIAAIYVKASADL
jgi:L-methionine (R)-S-oxide reductase